MSDRHESSGPRLCAVIVLYREDPAQSRAIQSFKEAFEVDPALASQLFVCVYDNSPQPPPLPSDLFPCGWMSFQPGQNDGLAVAYNAALDIAGENSIRWLLMLDSDTQITPSFVNACLDAIALVETDERVAALVPRIVENGAIHSPRFASAWRRHTLGPEIYGVINEELVAMNSGSVLRVSAVAALGGFNTDFWLDYLDYWLFRSLHLRAWRVFVLREALAHSLSFADPISRMSHERYGNMLAAEHYFVAGFGSQWERIRLKLVLIKRAVSLGLRPGGARLSRLTFRQLFLPYKQARPPANVSTVTEK
jgi:glycosyltransferase involved in cell wall biosynthesis